MAWTYDDALPTDKDTVRFYLGDTDETDPLASDEGILKMLTVYEDVFEATAALADGLATKFARMPTITVDGLTVKGTDRAEQFRILAANMRRISSKSAAGSLGVPFVSGTSISEMDGVASDPDRAPNKFDVGQDDFPGTASVDLPFTRII